MPNEITDPNNPAGTYQPNQQDWDRASGDLNAWKDKNAAGQNINWDAARKVYDQRASTGQGNYGDWVNSTLDQSKSWLSGGTPTASTTTPTTPARGNFDLEAVRKAWAYGGKGHTQQVTPDELQQFMKQNQNILGGAELRGEKLFNNGKFIADMIGNYKTGDPNKMSRIFLDGIGANGKPRGRTPQTKPPVGPISPDGGVSDGTGRKGPGWATSHGGDNDPMRQFLNGGGAGGNGRGINPPGPPNLPPGGSSSSSSSTQSVAPIRDPRLDELYNTLMGRANQGLAVDRNNPVVRAQADAFSANQERSRRNYLADTAESSGPNANLRNEERMSAERMGQATGGFEAELMGREVQAKRDEISNALNNAQGLLTMEQQLALQQKLANMDDVIKRMGLAQSDKQFGLDLGYRNRALSQNDRQFGRDLDYRNRALNQSDDQFRDRLGFDYADRSSYWDSLYRGAQ